MKKISASKLSFVFAFLYVGWGTAHFCLSIPDDFTFVHCGMIATFLDRFFLPVTLIPSIILLVEPHPFYMLLVSQLITLLVVWPVLFGIISLFRKIRKSLRAEKAE